jgi:hypothetical protein
MKFFRMKWYHWFLTPIYLPFWIMYFLGIEDKK